MIVEQAAWYLARGSGILAYVLLASSTIWGLLLGSKMLGGGKRSRALLLTHETISISAFVTTVIHVAALVADNYVHFGWTEVLVPGASAWEPLAVAWGVTALYAQVIVTFSFYVRSKIGQKAWRMLHFGAFGVFGAVTLHGLQAGTDAQNPAVIAMYAGSVVAVIGLTILRGVTYGANRRKTTKPAPRAHPVRA